MVDVVRGLFLFSIRANCLNQVLSLRYCVPSAVTIGKSGVDVGGWEAGD